MSGEGRGFLPLLPPPPPSAHAATTARYRVLSGGGDRECNFENDINFDRGDTSHGNRRSQDMAPVAETVGFGGGHTMDGSGGDITLGVCGDRGQL